MEGGLKKESGYRTKQLNCLYQVGLRLLLQEDLGIVFRDLPIATRLIRDRLDDLEQLDADEVVVAEVVLKKLRPKEKN